MQDHLFSYMSFRSEHIWVPGSSFPISHLTPPEYWILYIFRYILVLISFHKVLWTVFSQHSHCLHCDSAPWLFFKPAPPSILRYSQNLSTSLPISSITQSYSLALFWLYFSLQIPILSHLCAQVVWEILLHMCSFYWLLNKESALACDRVE